MKLGKGSLFVLLFLVFALAACGGEQVVPTQVPLAQLPQATATSSLPPTLDISSETIVEVPTQVTSTPPPTTTPLPLDYVINISAPRANEVLTLGNEIAVRGLVEREEGYAVALSLVTNNGRLIAQVPGTITENGWEAVIFLPPNVSGLAKLQANLFDTNGDIVAQHENPVLLQLNPNVTTDRFLTLDNPRIGETAVGGFNIFFDGTILRAVNNLVTISIWTNNCQDRVAQQSYRLGASSNPFYWQGFVIVPKDVTGEACAVASFGEPETESWREVQFPIEILPPDADNARGVTIGNPPLKSELFAGEEILVYGVAQNVAYGPVTVSVLMENGRIVGQTTTETDLWGYFETSVLLPFDVLGLAEITVSAGEDETFSENETIVNVLPAPTPTP